MLTKQERDAKLAAFAEKKINNAAKSILMRLEDRGPARFPLEEATLSNLNGEYGGQMSKEAVKEAYGRAVNALNAGKSL